MTLKATPKERPAHALAFLARFNDPTPTPERQREAQTAARQPTAAEHACHAAANAEQVRLLRAHLTGGKPC